MRILITLLSLLFICNQTAYSQISAKLMQYMDVSSDQIAFVYGGDIWISPKEGGQAVRLTSSQGEESWPKFSPDGTHIG